MDRRFENIKIEEMSPEMGAYLEEVNQVVAKLYKLGHVDQIFEQKLLLAMDKGWGESAFAEAIRDTLLPYYDVSKEKAEVRLLQVPKDKSSIYWESQLDLLKGITNTAKNKGGFTVIVLDFFEQVENLKSVAFLNIMEKFAKEIKDAMFIIWIPYGTKSSRKYAESRLSAVMPLGTIEIPPISEEMQVKYMSDILSKKEFQLDHDCEEVLKRWLRQKDQEGNHKGFSTLDNMCGSLIYHKIRKDNDTLICQSDIEEMLVSGMHKQDAYELLNELIGMSQLKGKIREIVAQIKLQKQLHNMGKKIEKPSLHMAFLGNPGTGKTTLARILGQIFKQENILRIGNFYEHSGNEFLAGNVAEMVRMMRSACKESYGSVMFIDEAYGMAVGHSNGNTGDDIVPILVEEMENHRDDMCVIFAGYEDEMEAFLNTNSGLESRIPHILHFPNYSREELLEIFDMMAEGCFEYEEELKETLQEYLESISDAQYESKKFANARFIRNLYERTWGKAAYRINFTDDKEIILKEEDLQAALEEEMFVSMREKHEKRKIGFGVN